MQREEFITKAQAYLNDADSKLLADVVFKIQDNDNKLNSYFTTYKYYTNNKEIIDMRNRKDKELYDSVNFRPFVILYKSPRSDVSDNKDIREQILKLMSEVCNLILDMDIVQDEHCPTCLRFNGSFIYKQFEKKNPDIDISIEYLKNHMQNPKFTNSFVLFLESELVVKKFQENFENVFVFNV